MIIHMDCCVQFFEYKSHVVKNQIENEGSEQSKKGTENWDYPKQGLHLQTPNNILKNFT